MKTKIAIYEDHSSLRESLKMLLEATELFEVVSTHPNCKNVLNNTQIHQPDIILMDIDMPEINGIEGLKLLKADHFQVRVIILTVFEDDDKIFQAFKAGTDGYLLKNSIGTQLIPSLKESLIGGTSISPGIALRVLNNFKEKKNKIELNLNNEEAEVLELTIVGFTYSQIANHLAITEIEVRKLINNIHLKMQINDAPKALAKFLIQKLKQD